MTTYLTQCSDQAVRHAVDAYIDGRLLPTFEGDAFFETRNSKYRLLDGVVFSASDSTHLGAELVGWLVEYPARAEISPSWRNGARAVLVDTRNDGVKGPHIIVTSATRGFRAERAAGAPAPRPPMPSPHDVRVPQRGVVPPPPPHPSMAPSRPSAAPPLPGSRVAQDGPSAAQAWRLSDLPPMPVRQPATMPPPPAPPMRHPATLPPPPTMARPGTLPPPPPLPLPYPAPPSRLSPVPPPPAMVMKAATLPPPPPPRRLPPVHAPQPPAFADSILARRIAATVDAALAAAGDFDDDGAPTARDERHRTASRLSHGASVGAGQRPAARVHAGFDTASHARPGFSPAPAPPASVPFLLSRSFQRGMPLR